jgi:hypothetical protein
MDLVGPASPSGVRTTRKSLQNAQTGVYVTDKREPWLTSHKKVVVNIEPK